MVTKKELINLFQKNPERYWKVKLFDELGFKRKACKNCGNFFWTLTDGETCNNSTCKPYEFIKKPLTKKPLDIFKTWKLIQKFFIDNSHIPLKRYPTVCRWYPLYFTIAGIVNFYRVDERGNLDWEFPANPTILLQPSLRFNDIQNVGLNSKSFTCFGMVQQTSLFDGKNGYWKDKCIELDFNLLTKAFGIKPEEINFVEDVWIGYGAFGSSLEYHVQGLELGNAVFTEFRGTLENYREMKEKIIDMGAGWERFAWITQGAQTCYDAAFGPVLKKMRKACDLEYDKKIFLKYAKVSGKVDLAEFANLKGVLSKIAIQLGISVEELKRNIEPLRILYSIADHTRTLVFALADGGLPSNVAGGYNLRVILRRALSFMERLNFNAKLQDVALWHVDYLKKMFPELAEHRDEIVKVLEVEEKRYRQAKERSKRIIESLKGREISEQELINLYDSQGITPEDIGIEVPEDFYAKITERHMSEKKVEKEKIFDVSGLQPTKILFYEKPNCFEFKAKVLKVFNNFAVLDQTAFYPEAGGQKSDRGFINGVEVIDVQKVENVILHQLKEKIVEGKVVNCKVDEERRRILTRHHTATHIINAAARKILGSWVWQHGAEKDIDKARLDITHYESLTDEEMEKIENLSNEIIEKNLPIKVEILPRKEAEEKYGFKIYQGGVPGKEVRVVSIDAIDHQACGGTHCKSTGELGLITILKSKRIQDGVVRIEFAAGDVALTYLKEKERILMEVAKKLKVKEEEVPEAIKKLFKNWKKLRKLLRKARKVKNAYLKK